MAHSTRFYGGWINHDGKTVVLDGIKHRLRCDVYRQRYPYDDEVISVHAEPVSKRTSHYREIKRQLGDDWSTDVLDSGIELQAEILRQVA